MQLLLLWEWLIVLMTILQALETALLSEQQFGFRRFHSTSTALLDCTDVWYVNMDRRLYNLAVFLD
jgi:hypothetical protein